MKTLIKDLFILFLITLFSSCTNSELDSFKIGESSSECLKKIEGKDYGKPEIIEVDDNVFMQSYYNVSFGGEEYYRLSFFIDKKSAKLVAVDKVRLGDYSLDLREDFDRLKKEYDDSNDKDCIEIASDEYCQNISYDDNTDTDNFIQMLDYFIYDSKYSYLYSACNISSNNISCDDKKVCKDGASVNVKNINLMTDARANITGLHFYYDLYSYVYGRSSVSLNFYDWHSASPYICFQCNGDSTLNVSHSSNIVNIDKEDILVSEWVIAHADESCNAFLYLDMKKYKESNKCYYYMILDNEDSKERFDLECSGGADDYSDKYFKLQTKDGVFNNFEINFEISSHNDYDTDTENFYVAYNMDSRAKGLSVESVEVLDTTFEPMYRKAKARGVSLESKKIVYQHVSEPSTASTESKADSVSSKKRVNVCFSCNYKHNLRIHWSGTSSGCIFIYNETVFPFKPGKYSYYVDDEDDFGRKTKTYARGTFVVRPTDKEVKVNF